MVITNYYRGCTDRLSGFVFDTERKTYREFVIPGKTWTQKLGFHVPGDLDYYFKTLCEMQMKLTDVKLMGFKEDKDMALDFGIFIM